MKYPEEKYIGSQIFAGCEYYEIDPETLCQYTGSRDNNSVRIWENDIVLCKSGETKFSFNEIMLVDDIINYQTMSILTECEYLEVLGNPFDNPELLSKCTVQRP